ncbi:isocitrate lyase/PEP mutase family protein [Ancylobacter oerskovii]|uniref:Oxaloacetate decarboxylase n=1 Tax=Ancylobacter oerskovii TaxID=459519 RepID=A0ABW4YZA6_9HYPH|nr:isocitrate lyase/PEP mutase family protein [Ancylobacter oerskovii]MBS7543822.1 isocitrate lyase/PEP mutase family protein [Ancylobacter oerskovii]
MHLRKTVVDGKMSTELRRQIREDAWPLPWISGATPHHAQLAEAAGFRLFGLSGSQAAAHILGLPDAGLMTLTEVVANIRHVCEAVSIPVIADCETGFGNVVNTTRAVHEFIKAGAAGFFLEDQVFPKRCGYTKGVQVIPVDDAVAKYRAACDKRAELDPDVVILARTDSRAAVGGSVDEVLRRCDAYLRTEVDMLMIMALQSREEIRRVREAFPDALMYINASAVKPALGSDEYREFGVVTYNISIAKVAQLMMQDFLADCRARGADALNDFNAGRAANPLGEFGYLELTGFPQVVEIERRYLPEASLDRYDSSLGVYDPR